MHGAVRAVPVFGSDGSALESFLSVFQCCFQQKGTVLVPVAVPETPVPTVPVSVSGSWKNGSDGSGCRFGSRAILQKGKWGRPRRGSSSFLNQILTRFQLESR